MNKIRLLLAIIFLIGKLSQAQVIIDKYIAEGLQNNQSIKQQQFAFEKSVLALLEAKSLYFPKLSLHADYFRAGGGRTVDFPAGDLLNPVYASLNQLTNSNNFPRLENQSILLNPNNFYDARVRTTLPLINLEIAYNKRIKREQVQLQKLELSLYKRELVKEIKIAYYTFLKSVQAVKVYESALNLVEKSYRVNEYLYKNNKVNRAVLLRVENEKIKIDALQQSAIQQSKSAQAYVNFLLNRNLEEELEIDSNLLVGPENFYEETGLTQREEISKLQTLERIQTHIQGLSKSYGLPKVNSFIDLGSQGFDGKFNDKTQYYFMGVSLQWDLFSAGKNYYNVKQSGLDYKMAQSNTDYLSGQLALQISTAGNNLKSALLNYQATLSVWRSSQIFYQDVFRQYKEGQVIFLELIEAQNQLVQAELQVAILRCETQIKMAELERARASYQLNND